MVQHNTDNSDFFVLFCFLHCQKLTNTKAGRMNLHVSQDDGMGLRQEDNQFWARRGCIMRLSQNIQSTDTKQVGERVHQVASHRLTTLRACFCCHGPCSDREQLREERVPRLDSQVTVRHWGMPGHEQEAETTEQCWLGAHAQLAFCHTEDHLLRCADCSGHHNSTVPHTCPCACLCWVTPLLKLLLLATSKVN